MKGRDAVEQGNYQAACPTFAESYRLDAKVGTLLNLADCEEHVGQLAEALQHWQQALQLAIATNDRRIDEARARLAGLESRVPRLTIRLAPNVPASATITRDGVSLGRPSLGVPLSLNPGDHVVEVRAAGHEPRRYAVAVAEGETKELNVSAGRALSGGPVRPNAPATPADREPPAAPDNTLAYVLGGIGVAGVVVGSVTGAMLMSKNRTIDEQCNASNECSPAGLEAVDQAKGLLPISNVAWIVGVVGLGAGTVLLVTSGSPTPPRESTGALVRPRGIGLHVVGEL